MSFTFLDKKAKEPFAATKTGIAVNTVLGLPKAALTVAKNIGRGIARNVASVGVTVAEKVGGPDEVAANNIKNLFGQELWKTTFGDEPIQSIEKRVINAEEKLKTNQFAREIGLDKYATPLAFAGIMGSVGLDLTPFGGLEKNAAKAIISASADNVALNIAKNLGADEQIAKQLAPIFVRTKTEKEAKQALELAESLIKTKSLAASKVNAVADPLLAEARKYKSAEEFVKAKQKLYRGADTLELGKGYTDAVWVSEDIGYAKLYGKNVSELYLQKNNIKMLDSYSVEAKNLLKEYTGKKLSQLPENDGQFEMLREPEQGFIDFLKKKGYEGMKDDLNVAVFDKENLLTKSQLTDIWNKANKVEDNVVKKQVYKQSQESSVLLDETNALKSARIGKGDFQPGEVYTQDLGSLGKRGVLISGKNADGSITGWYLPSPGSAKLLGIKGAYLEEATFRNPKKELTMADVDEDQLKQVIDAGFFSEKKARPVNRAEYDPGYFNRKLPEQLEARKTAIEIEKEMMKDNPLNNLTRFTAKSGEFKGRLPEVLGKGKSKFGRRGDDIITEHLGDVDSETARARYENFASNKASLKEREAALRADIQEYYKGKKLSSEGIPLALNRKQVEIAAEPRPVEPYKGGTGEVRSVEKAAEESRLLATQQSGVEIPSLIKIVPQTPLKSKVGIVDYLRTPENVLKKIGLEKEGNFLRSQYEKYVKELPANIEKISSWANRVSKESNQRIFRYLDNENIDLTHDELTVALEVKGWLAQWADRLNLPKDNRISNYITHIFDDQLIKKEFDEDLAKIIRDKIPGTVYDPFLQKRLGAKGYRQDTWAALDAYVKRATRKVNLDPALTRIEEVAGKLEDSQFEYLKRYVSSVNMRPTDLDNRIDNSFKQFFGYKFGQRPVANISKTLRQFTFRGMLGGNLSSALRNISQGVNTYAKLGEKYTAIGYINLAKKGMRELEEVGVLADNFIQDRTLSSTKKAIQKVDKMLFFFFDTAEKINRGAAYYGAKAKGLSKGMDESSAIEYAKKIVRETQFNYGSIDTPVGMGSDISKLFLQFMTYPVKQTEFLTGLVKNKEYAGVARYVLGGLGFVYTVGSIFGMEPSELIPFSNIVSGQSKFGVPPSLKLPAEVIKAVAGAPDKYGRKRNIGKKLRDVGNQAWGAVPAGLQLKKTIQGIDAVSKGESRDRAGRKQFDVGGTLPKDIQAIIFGKYANPQSKAYFNKSSKKKNSSLTF